MPLSIIRNDITNVAADAIVNTANPYVAVGEGTDFAIYSAAGIDELLEERARIGEMQPGQAAVTPALALDAKYIIHTVGPAWRGGGHGERETVASCYRNCLAEAAQLGCESVAFPLISTGTYGFPKNEALDIAIREITSFLEDHDMDVTLVVYDKESFALSSALVNDVRSYIDDAYVLRSKQVYSDRFDAGSAFPETSYDEGCALPRCGAPTSEKKAGSLPQPKGQRRRGIRGLFRNRPVHREEELQQKSFVSEEDSDLPEESPVSFDGMYPDDADFEEAERTESAGELFGREFSDRTLEELLRSRDESFQQKLFRLIDSRGMTDPEVYKKANIDRKLFSKIRGNVDYKPRKSTAIAFAVALGLNLDETTDLLRSAGFSLSPSNSFDIIIRYCIEHGITNIHEINCILFEFDQMLLGA